MRRYPCLIALLTLVTALNGQSYETRATWDSPTGGDGFTKIPAEASGLTLINAYDDPAMWTDRFLEHGFGSIATGVAVGDIDGDGLPDLYLVRRAGPNALYRNTGDLTFEEVTATAGVAGDDAWNNGATFVDIDGDGDLDLYVCYLDAPNALYVNQGDGTFTEEAAERGLAIHSNTVMAAFADADRDGDLDAYLATNRLDAQVREGEPDYFLVNQGDGTFVDRTEEAGFSGNWQTFVGAWWDYNDDGWPDLYVANDFIGPDYLYRNNQDGTFTNVAEEALPSTSYYSMGADFGDINRDGRLDFLVSDMYPRDFSRFLLNHAELYEAQGDQLRKATPQIMRNNLFLNAGQGTFTETAWLAGVHATDWTWAVLFGDLDQDGWSDAYVTNGMFRDFMNSDAIMRISRMRGTRGNVVWKRQPELREANLALRNTGDLGFVDKAVDWGLAHIGISFGAALADLDRDGDLDVIASEYEDTPLLYRNDQASGNSLLVSLRGPGANTFGIGARVTARLPDDPKPVTRELALARGIVSGQEPVLHFGLGDVDIVSELVIRWTDGRVTRLRNVPANQWISVDHPGQTAPFMQPMRDRAPYRRVEATVPEHAFEPVPGEVRDRPLLPFRPLAQGPALAAVGDNRLLVAGDSANPGYRLTVSEDGSVSTRELPALRGSGFAEVASRPDGSARYWLAGDSTQLEQADRWVDVDPQGGVTLSEVAGSFGQPGWDDARPADFDGDGDQDLLVFARGTAAAYPRGPGARLMERTEDGWENATGRLAPGLADSWRIRDAAWGDLNGDDRPDLVLVGPWQAPRLFLNRPEGLEPVPLPDDLSGLWRSVVIADPDDDGQPSIFLGNLGQNTRYQPTPDQPYRLLVGDFSEKGETHILEVYQDEDGLRPWRGRSELLDSLNSPSFAGRMVRQFRTFEAFAERTVDELFPAEILEAATPYRVTEVRSGELRRDGDGIWAFHPFPGLAQAGPVDRIVVAEFSGDGKTDLFLAQGSREADPGTGPFVGALSTLLVQQSGGTWATPLPGETGLMVPGDAQDAAILYPTGGDKPWLVVSRYGARLMLFAPTGQ
ncbi:MAG: VCBS repeat-containing protein [Opitutales bacterium]